MTTFDIRPFQESDREPITNYQNKFRPPHLQETVAEWKRGDDARPAEEVRLRLCIGEPAVAYMGVVDRSTSAWRKPGACSFSLEVDREHRHQGLGSALYERAIEFARQRGSARLLTFAQFYEPGDPAARFLEKRGFVEVDRTVPVMLDLTRFDRERFPTPHPEGIHFVSYAEAGDTEPHRRKLHALMTQLDRDIPTNDVHPEPPVFEEWVKDIGRPEWNSEALLLAANDAGEWIGLSQLGFQEHTNIGWTFLTGVLPEHRGQGIAYALKLRALDAAMARGCPLILTENHEDNAPMRAINKKLGFVPDAPAVSYSKDIKSPKRRHDMTAFDIRPFRDEDREPLIEIGNRDRPKHRQGTAAAWARRDTLRKPEMVDIRLCAADPQTDRAIAFLAAADLNTTGFKMKDVCDFDIMVDHAHRGQGIASLLYDKAVEFATERGAKRMVTSFREWTPEEPAIAFLKERGFAEQERETPSYLDLTTWDESPFLGSLGQAAAYGARILSYDMVEDSDENRRKFYELEKALVYDIPRRDTQPFTFEPYEDFVRSVIERPEWRPDLHLMAEKDGEWIGKCHVVPKLETPEVGMQWLTGVLKAHRGNGLATALKVRAYERARAAGVTIMTTDNHEDNAPMLAINKKFGFIPEPSVVAYNKVLRE